MDIARILAYRPHIDEMILAATRTELSAAAAAPGTALVRVDAGSPADLIAETLTINEQGFDPSAPAATADGAEEFRPNLDGCVAIILREQGIGVATGMTLPVRDGVAELAGIATLQPHRRRGHGATVTLALAEAAFELGADLVFLTTDDETAARLYRRIGFRTPTSP